MSVNSATPHVYGENDINHSSSGRDEESQPVDVHRIELVYR